MSETSIGAKVRNVRESVGKSREQIAFAAGISTSTVTRLENEGRLPNVVALKRITDQLEISLDDLLSESTPSSSTPMDGEGVSSLARTG